VKFNKALRGYDPVSVQEKFANLADLEQLTIRGLERELKAVEEDIARYDEQIRQVRGELAHQEIDQTEIKNLFYSTHLATTIRVMSALKKAEEMSRDTRETYLNRQREKDSLQRELHKLSEEIRVIAGNYNSVLEAFKHA